MSVQTTTQRGRLFARAHLVQTMRGMPEIAYEFRLDPRGLDWFRFRIMTERGQVVTFTAQYETTLDG